MVLLELEVSLVSWVTRCRTSRSSFTRGDKHHLNIPAKRSETANILLLLLLHCLIETHRIPPSTPCYVCLFKEIDCCPLLKLLRNVTHTHTHTHTCACECVTGNCQMKTSERLPAARSLQFSEDEANKGCYTDSISLWKLVQISILRCFKNHLRFVFAWGGRSNPLSAVLLSHLIFIASSGSDIFFPRRTNFNIVNDLFIFHLETF